MVIFVRTRAAIIFVLAGFVLGTPLAFDEAYVVIDKTGSLALHQANSSGPPSGAIVFGSFADTIASTGVSHLRVKTVAPADDVKLFEALGYAEGSLTAHRVVQHMFNSLQEAAPPAVLSFLAEYDAYLRDAVLQFGASDPYWRVIGLFLANQRGFLLGLHSRLLKLPTDSLIASGDGFRLRSRLDAYKQRLLSDPDYMASEYSRLNLQCDTDEIVTALEYRSLPFLQQSNGPDLAAGNDSLMAAAVKTVREDKRRSRGHCSALVKVAGPRLLMGHATWAGFYEMLRVFKEVEFTHAAEPALASRVLAFTTYPGFYASTDDWIVLPDQNLHVMETTLTVYNKERLARHVTPRTVMTPLRSMVASVMATSPRTWYHVFSRENSGTQNNQWMIVNTAAWAKPAGEKTDVLWVLEQMPGMVIAHDQTRALLKHGYWASYNMPYYEESKRVSMPTYMYFEGAAALGSVCNCENQRGALFKEMHHNVDSIASMQEILSSNTWRSNGNSWRCPKCSIAARYDLQGENVSIGREFSNSSAERNCGASDLFGAIDAKVVDDTMIAQGATYFVSGPSRRGVPPFDWGATPQTLPQPPHVGHPSGAWAFPWQHFGNAVVSPEESVASRLAQDIRMFV